MALDIASYIDHTLLKPVATKEDIVQLCEEAHQFNFAAVCVPPCYVRLAKELLNRSEVKVATVIGFPFGYQSAQVKIAEIQAALQAGADELDMVHHIAALKNDDWEYLEREIEICTQQVHAAGKGIKIIVESGLLTDEELIKCCNIYGALDIDFMKTSTGYAEVGATVHAVELMRKHLPDTVSIKASGGIRTFAQAAALVDAGANRLGCSASVQILKESSEGL
ncbi:MAG: deoxyribose-phosphate aldolase [Sphingobacteriales bacterium]|nr:MAG: deoxyribose-phosphate aldolase [Sphingobacteriales bacterium]